MMRDFWVVGLGGALGSMLRYAVSLATAYYSFSATVATFSVNTIGSLVLGMIIACSEKSSFYLFAAIGLCGGFTTFSTFSAQTFELFQTHRYGSAIVYAFLSLAVCLVFSGLGLYLGNKFCK